MDKGSSRRRRRPDAKPLPRNRSYSTRSATATRDSTSCSRQETWRRISHLPTRSPSSSSKQNVQTIAKDFERIQYSVERLHRYDVRENNDVRDLRAVDRCDFSSWIAGRWPLSVEGGRRERTWRGSWRWQRPRASIACVTTSVGRDPRRSDRKTKPYRPEVVVVWLSPLLAMTFSGVEQGTSMRPCTRNEETSHATKAVDWSPNTTALVWRMFDLSEVEYRIDRYRHDRKI